MIHKGRRSTGALTPVRKGEALEVVLRRLLQQASRAGIRPRLLLLDRGFSSVGVIRYRQAARTPFLMPVIGRGRKASDPRGPSGTNVFRSWKHSGWGSSTLSDSPKRRATVSIGVKCRNDRGQWPRHGRQCLVYASWGMQPGSSNWVAETYRQRFGIETSYRQLHQARIKTTSRSPLVRLLSVGVALIVRNVWVWLHDQVLATWRRGGRQINPGRLRFPTLLLWLLHVAEETLGTRDVISAERPL